MANKHKALYLDLNVVDAIGAMQQVRGELLGLEQVLTGLQTKLAVTFGAGTVLNWLWQTLAGTKEVSGALQTLHSSFSRLGNALSGILAPAVANVLEFLSGAVSEAARLVNWFGEILQVFFGVDKTVKTTTKSQKKLTAATKASAKALQRSLMGFDQINRLQKKSGGSVSSGSTAPAETVTTTKTQKLPELDFYQLGVLWMLRDFAEDLKSIDFSPVIRYLGYLHEAIKPHIPQLYAGLKFFWKEILLPITQWVIEEGVPKFLKLLTVALQALSVVIWAAEPYLQRLWNDILVPMGQWTGEKLLGAMDWMIQALADIANWIRENRESVGWIVGIVALLGLNLLQCGDAFGLFASRSTAQLNLVSTAMSAVNLAVGLVIAAIAALIAAIVLLVQNWDKVAAGAQMAWQGVKNAWQSASGWFRDKVLMPLQNGFRSAANGMIGIINGILRGITSGINAVIKAVNGISFTLPSWIPKLGGKSLGFHLKTVAAPQIPYLARGAVLPANKPFLAMVGDQRHGTNVEAPLATIQEAVALVMQDFIASNMAGQEATVAVLREILEAVLGISIGDDVIAGAVSRYNTRMAVVKGGQA